MGPIIGNIDSPYAKFVKELYVPRQDLKDAFDNFMGSSASVFGIVGAAGVGKTSAMCSLALQKLEDQFVFFYNAAIINKSPLEHVAQDLNGVFSSKSETDTILTKLNELGRFLDKNVLIFIDAIDENVDSTLALDLSEIALDVRNLEKVKICISCKSNIWNSIVIKNGTPTHLYEELNKFHNTIPSLNNCPGFLLEDFNNDEINNIIPLYKKFFGFKGEISEMLLNELRNGFFLRIFSEVYSHKEIPGKINDKELIRRYIQQSLEKTEMGLQFGLRILSKIGKILVNHKYKLWESFKDEGLEAESLVEKLDFSLEERIPEDLFTRNVLIKSNKEDSYNISFYYSKVRDYIICFHSYKLDKLDNTEFYDLLEKFYENHIGHSAISFYIENATASHKQTLVKFKKDKALTYVNSYNCYLEQHFKRFKEKFDPKTRGDIGIFLPDDLLQKDGYALFPLDPSLSNKVQHEKFGDSFLDDSDHNLFFQKGVNVIYGSNKSLLVADQSKIVRQNIFKQLKEIMKKGRLNAYNSDVLLLEQVSTILYYYNKKLGCSFTLEDYYLPRFDLIYPISLKNLRDKIYKFLVTEHYKRQNIDRKLIAEKVDNSLRENIDVPKLNIAGDFPPFEELFKIVEILLNKGYEEIAEHHLPCPDILIGETQTFYERKLALPQSRMLQFSEGQAQLYIERFLKHLDCCYEEFVEYCFPTFKDKFPFFMSLPHEYFVYMRDSDFFKGGMLGYRSSKCGEVKVNFKKFISSDEIFTSGETDILRGFSLDYMLHNDYHQLIKTIDRINTPKVDEFCVLRNWVYRFVKEDMNTLFKENEE